MTASGELKPCPCGKTPERLNIVQGPSCKYAYCVGNCCGEWHIEFCTQYHHIDFVACMDLAVEAWNRSPRLAAASAAPVNGKCCSCGYDGDEETSCSSREDGQHCVHWWEGAEDVPQEADDVREAFAALDEWMRITERRTDAYDRARDAITFLRAAATSANFALIQIEGGREARPPSSPQEADAIEAGIAETQKRGLTGLKHVCGLQGFGAIGDVCPACELDKRRTPPRVPASAEPRDALDVVGRLGSYGHMIVKVDDAQQQPPPAPSGWMPTHRHADGGLYAVKNAVRVKVGGEWKWHVLYEDERRRLFARDPDDFGERFAQLLAASGENP